MNAQVVPIALPTTRSPSIIATLSEVAATVQRRRTVDTVLEAAGHGVDRLRMRLCAFQFVGDEVVLRHLTTAATRRRAIEELIGRRVEGLSAPVAAWKLGRAIHGGRRIVYRHDLDVIDTFLRLATGYDVTPLDKNPETASVTAGVIAPLYVRDQAWGFLTVYSYALTPDDADAVALFATHVGSAIEVAESLEALARAQKDLVERERLAALGELAAVVAHEVRNPLGVIFNALGSLQGIVDAGAPRERLADARLLLGIATEESDRLKRIVADLLQFARPHEPDLDLYAAGDLVEEVVAEAGHDPRLEVDIEPDLPPVWMDPRTMRQALLNLVLNALQAAPPAGRVVVSTKAEERDGRSFTRFDIRDDGPGIPPDARASLFEPFFTTKSSGTGLGLPIVKRIVEAHEAALAFESSAGGTTFTIWLRS